MKNKSIKARQISYMVIICLLVILGAQFYMVHDYYQTTRSALARESDAMLDEIFKKDLNRRNKLFEHLIKTDTITVIAPAETTQNSFKADISKSKEMKGNALGAFELAIHSIVSRSIPVSIHCIDSIAGIILSAHGIYTEYYLRINNPRSGKLVAQSKAIFSYSPFQISSRSLIYDYEKNESLQLVLINPFGILFKRMGLMLLTSFVFSVICLLAFGLLQRILSRQKQLVAFKNEFLSTIAHELKRPVASLSYNLDCMTLPGFRQNATKHDMLIARSVNATEEMNNTINMIVALAKVEEGLLQLHKEPVNLSQLFLDLKERFTNSQVKHIEIRTVFESGIDTIQADTRLLTQCFANLIDNSIKYSGKEVLIVINIRQTGKWIVISIKDNGFGIPEEKLPVIFDKYIRLETANTKINGFGIGLNYVKTIVENHKGKVEVQSKSGEGTEFNVLLPV